MRSHLRCAAPLFGFVTWRASTPGRPLRWPRCRCPEIYDRLDHIDADTFLKSINFPDTARHLAFEVFSRSFFADPAQLSAAELATMFHIYFLGSSEGSDLRRRRNTNFDVSLWNPLRAHLAGHGVRFRLGLDVLRIDAGSAKAFRVHTDAGDHVDADAVVLATDVAGLRQHRGGLRRPRRRAVARPDTAAAHRAAVRGPAALA